MHTHDSRKWTGVVSASDPFIRDGNKIQLVYWRFRNALHAQLSRQRAYCLARTKLFSAYIVPQGKAAVLNVYVGRSWIGRDGRSKGKTWSFSKPFTAFDVAWSVELSKRYPPETVASGVVRAFKQPSDAA